MEVREAEKIVIAKPIPSRPSSTSFRTFSELLTSAINASPSNECPPIIVTAIRPKTWRFKRVVDHISADQAVSSKAEIDMILKSDNVVYKPMAKLASKTTVSVLANPGSFNLIRQQEEADIETPGEASLPKLEFQENSQLQAKSEKPLECSKLAPENLEEAHVSLLRTNTADRVSYDGYNWRKYGQKQVKGSEYPRSYYKCTYPNCPVKKKVERTLDDQITEIVYKGEHNHPKPEPLKRGSSDRQRVAFVSDARGSETNNPRLNNQISEFEKENEVGSSCHSTHSSSNPSFYDPVMAGEFFAGSNAAEDCDEVTNRFNSGGDGAKGKRRRNANHLDEVETSKESTKDPRIIVRNQSDSGILGDGFHWRKYGQKVVKGNTFPRSYYRCTSLKCNVRKFVERTSDDPGAFITTYEGRHNHDMPNHHHKHKFGGGI